MEEVESQPGEKTKKSLSKTKSSIKKAVDMATLGTNPLGWTTLLGMGALSMIPGFKNINNKATGFIMGVIILLGLVFGCIFFFINTTTFSFTSTSNVKGYANVCDQMGSENLDVCKRSLRERICQATLQRQDLTTIDPEEAEMCGLSISTSQSSSTSTTRAPTQCTANTSGEKRILIYGDSITNEQFTKYGNVLQSTLNARFTNNQFVVISDPGAIGFPGQNASNRNLDTEVLAFNPNIVLLWWGMNSGGDTGTQSAAYTNWVNTLKQRNIQVLIVNVTPVCSRPFPNATSPTCNGIGYGAENALNVEANSITMSNLNKSLASTLNVPLVDSRAVLERAFAQRGNCCTPFFNAGDGIHPNQEAHALIANAIADSLQSNTCR